MGKYPRPVTIASVKFFLTAPETVSGWLECLPLGFHHNWSQKATGPPLSGNVLNNYSKTRHFCAAIAQASPLGHESLPRLISISTQKAGRLARHVVVRWFSGNTSVATYLLKSIFCHRNDQVYFIIGPFGSVKK